MRIEDLILPGAIIIGGYILFTKFKDIVKPVTDILPPISDFNKPIVPSPPGYAPAPTPINYGVPVTGVPGFIDFAKNPIGGKGTPTPSYGAFLFPPLGIFDAITSLPKLIDATIGKKTTTATKPSSIIIHPSVAKALAKTNVGKIVLNQRSVKVAIPSKHKPGGM